MPTSCGRNGTTSSRFRRTARSATSGWVGPATSRCSRRRARPCSRRRRSGEAGCATSPWSRTRNSECRAWYRTWCSGSRSGWGGPAGRTRRRSFRGRCTRRTATRPSSKTSGRACARGSIHSPTRRGADGLLIASQQFGDWLDPDAPPGRPWEAKADSELLANAFFAHSARLVADAARLREDGEATARYQALANDVAARTWARWQAHAVTTQTGCAAVLGLGIAPESERAGVARTLAKLVREADGRVATGFLGTPLVLPALSAAGHLDEAYSMLLRRVTPSWLYQVDQGATTVWERWDAILPDGSIHPGTMTHLEGENEGQDSHMLSFNHYAYGAVMDWVYRHVAGLSPLLDAPGYREVVLSPKPSRSVGWARASIEFGDGRDSARVAARGCGRPADRFGAAVRRPGAVAGPGYRGIDRPDRRRPLVGGGDARGGSPCHRGHSRPDVAVSGRRDREALDAAPSWSPATISSSSSRRGSLGRVSEMLVEPPAILTS